MCSVSLAERGSPRLSPVAAGWPAGAGCRREGLWPVGGQDRGLDGQVEVADDGMVEEFDAAGVDADVVRGRVRVEEDDVAVLAGRAECA